MHLLEMMIPNAPDIPKSPPRIKHDGKFYSMLLSKESSLANHSFRVASGSVPFVWESVPGTPKVAVAVAVAALVPPITPPPSYWYHSRTAVNLKSMTSDNKNKEKKKKKRNFIAAIFRNLTLISRKQTQPPSSRISSSSRSSSPSPSFSQSSFSSSRFSSSRMLFSSTVRDDPPDDLPRCFLCFRVRSIPNVLFFRRGRKGKIVCDDGSRRKKLYMIP